MMIFMSNVVPSTELRFSVPLGGGLAAPATLARSRDEASSDDRAGSPGVHAALSVLEALVRRISAARIVSGMGERPAPVHLSRFGLASFTTGCGCIAPRTCMQLLGALKRGDLSTAESLHARFMPLENLREEVSLIRVLHDAVTLSGLADMGPQLPLLSASPPERLAEIKALAITLLAYERSLE